MSPPAQVSPAGAPGRRSAGAPVCYDCFWRHQPDGFRDELAAHYATQSSPDPLVDGERRYLLARVRGDREGLCDVRRDLEALGRRAGARPRRLLVAETLAFTAEECGADPSAAFDLAARAARDAGDDWKAGLYREAARGALRPEFGEATIPTSLSPPAGTTWYVLGNSEIRVRRGERIGVQVERTVRDWISYQLSWDLSGRRPRPERLIPWHEGSRLQDILRSARARVVPLTGVLAARREDRWFAADETGVFRFEVLLDKMQYPTVRSWDDLALLVDTHGVSSVAGPALRAGVSLVIACGDHPEKMKAAVHLARRGVDVYFPCDRYAGEILGYEARGTLIGSAPVRAGRKEAVIGGRPVAFRVDEPVVVEDTSAEGNERYYDAAARYFRRLAEVLPLRLEVVPVDGSGGASKVVAKAAEIGASAIALRVQTEEDAASVRGWLAADPSRRAVLFHTAPYPAGNALFMEFPGRTTFGDPRPLFLRG